MGRHCLGDVLGFFSQFQASEVHLARGVWTFVQKSTKLGTKRCLQLFGATLDNIAIEGARFTPTVAPSCNRFGCSYRKLHWQVQLRYYVEYASLVEHSDIKRVVENKVR